MDIPVGDATVTAGAPNVTGLLVARLVGTASVASVVATNELMETGIGPPDRTASRNASS